MFFRNENVGKHRSKEVQYLIMVLCSFKTRMVWLMDRIFLSAHSVVICRKFSIICSGMRDETISISIVVQIDRRKSVLRRASDLFGWKPERC